MDILSQAFTESGHEVVEVNRLKDIPLHSNILTVTDKDAVLAHYKRKPKFLANWFQGITPEEMVVFWRGKLSMRPRQWLHHWLEKKSLRCCDLPILVSKSMFMHFKKKYGFEPDNYFIMPCFADEINPDLIKPERYTHPTFVYCGSLDNWQCGEQMLLLFKKIKQQLPEATLSIFSGATEEVKRLLEKHQVEASIDFVSPSELTKTLSKFKYGLLYRNDIAMNNVATPTKISNYMAAGIIPVFSDVIDDYKENISRSNHYVIPFCSDQDCIDKLKEMEKVDIEVDRLRKEFTDTFNSFWNRDKYVKFLKEMIASLMPA